MPETYTGTEGTDAALAGMAALDGTEDRRKGWLAINKTRDYIAARYAELKAYAESLIPAVWSTAKGGTGSGNLYGVTDTSTNGGLLIVTPSGKLARGSGAIAQAYIPGGIPASKIDGIPTPDLSSRVAKTGDTMTGNLGLDNAHLFVPSAGPATEGWQLAYINRDGRLSRGSSSERYKKHIGATDPASLGDVFPDLYRYQMRHGAVGDWKYGHIAERLAEHPDQRAFVVYALVDGEWVPDSIDFIALAQAQIAQLHQALDLMAQRLDELEGRA